MQEHNAFIQEFDDTINQENQLLSSILEKRLQINRGTDSE